MNCKHKETDRSWLYVMVFITMLASCEAERQIDKLEDKIESLERIIKSKL